MIDSFTALLFAHVLADFLFQTRWMVDNKHRPAPLALHIAIVFALSLVALGGGVLPALVVAALHLLIDVTKARAGDDSRLRDFLLDQGAHLASLLGTALVWHAAYAEGLWVRLPAFAALWPAIMAVVAGGVLATRAGQFAVGKLMAPFKDAADGEGLANGGALIGLLERGLTFLLVLAGQPAGVGFLIAAKSLLRVGSIEKDRKLAEYVIIGTLASIGWALVAAYATQTLLDRLAPS